MLSAACPSDDQLSAYLAGGLEGGARVEIGEHIDFCNDCRQLVVAAVQSARGAALREAKTLADGSGPSVAAAAPEALTPTEIGVGLTLGRYHLLELLGTGGMGQVYRARDLELDRDVALKVLRPGLAGSAELLTARLLRESRLMARLSHPAVVSVFDVGRQGALVYVAMELIEGTTLAHWLRERRSVDEVLAAFVAAGRGLLAAHVSGMVHRDFKPDNVLISLDRGGRVARVVVTDLGVARALTPSPAEADPRPPRILQPSTAAASTAGARSEPSPARPASRTPAPALAAVTPASLRSAAASLPQLSADEGLTVPGATVGTPAYMAPEQLEGRAVDQRADVFSFAASLWEALWGTRPFPGRTMSEIAAAMAKPPRQAAPRGRIPRRVTKALREALQIDANRRTPALGPLLAALDPVAARQRKLLVAGAAAAALVTSSAAAAVVLPSRQGADPCGDEDRQVAALVAQERLAALTRALGPGPQTHEVAADLTERVAKWRQVHGRTCPAGERGASSSTSAQASSALTAACLAARRRELTGVLEDLTQDPVLRPVAGSYLSYLGDVGACERATAGMALSLIPDDPAQRQAVRRLRARLLAAEQLRRGGTTEEALTRLRDIRVAAEARWPVVYAEALYAEGGAEGAIGDSSRASETLKRAAAVAEKAHHDRVAAWAWTQLISAATFADNDVDRALEYATYADAALDRIGRPPYDETLWLYYYGAALAQADRADEGEAKMRAALHLAEQHSPPTVPLIVQGLGFLYDARGDYAKAVEMYKTAIATSKEPKSATAIYHAQLALNLARQGARDEALHHADQAVADATDGIDPRNDEWQTIKGTRILVLRHLGRFEEALADIPGAQARAAAARGKRSDDVAMFEQLEALLLADLGKVDEAARLIRRACDTMAMTIGEGSIDHAGCLADQAAIELRAGELDAAQAAADAAIAVVEETRSFHADVALVYQVRGELARRRGDLTRAAADLDRAIAIYPGFADRGYLASSQLAKARLLADSDRAAALALLGEAIASWQPAPGQWKRELDEARALAARLGR